jgi:hypothetical protein
MKRSFALEHGGGEAFLLGMDHSKRKLDGTLHLGEFAYEASMGISPTDRVLVPGEARPRISH